MTTAMVSTAGNRVFFDIARSGCGNGCVYCYVPSAALPQRLFSREDVLASCGDLIERFGGKGYVVSLCPNTEPLKSPASFGLVCDIVGALAPHGFVFQISTKELLTGSMLEALDGLRAGGRIYLNISLPMLGDTSVLEPGCPSPEAREGNFARIARFPGLSSCLYIKPFTERTGRNLSGYAALIDRCRPDHIVVGIEYRRGESFPCESLHVPEKARAIHKSAFRDIITFADELSRLTGRVVRHSSICQIVNTEHTACGLQLYRYDKNLCKECEESVNVEENQ